VIRVNLLEQASVAAPKKTGKSASPVKVLVVLLLLIMLGAGGGFIAMLFVGVPEPLQAYIPQKQMELALNTVRSFVEQEDLPVEQSTNIAVPSQDAVEDVVRNIHSQIAPRKIRKQEYRELLPVERIQHQKFMMQHFLNVLKKITPPSVGYMSLSAQVPDYFYMTGVAENAAVLKKFSSDLQVQAREFKPMPAKDIGSGTEKQFTYYGRVRLPAFPSKEKMLLVDNKNLGEELNRIKALARESNATLQGFSSPRVSRHGMYRRIIYQTHMNTDFPSLIRFLDKLYQDQVRIGILKLDLSADDGETMRTSMELVIYTNN